MGEEKCQLAFGSKPLAKMSFYPFKDLIYLNSAFAICDVLRRETK